MPAANEHTTPSANESESQDLTPRALAEQAMDLKLSEEDEAGQSDDDLIPVDYEVSVENQEFEQEENEEEDVEPGSMTLVEHLGELRDRLVRCLLYVGVGCGITLSFGKQIIDFLQQPAGPMQFQALSIEEPLLVYFKVSFYAGLVLSSPFILLEVSRFIAPGLTNKEKRIVTPALVGGPVLFVCGAAFAYYCLLPTMFHFFNTFSGGIAPIHQRLDFYMSLVASILLYMGLCFQLPIVLFALSFTGLVTSNQLIKFWRYAVFGASCVALVITPDPTAFSMLLVIGALVGLYAISVILLKLFGR